MQNNINGQILLFIELVNGAHTCPFPKAQATFGARKAIFN